MVEQVSLYRAPTTEADADALADWLSDRIDATVTVCDRFCSLYADDSLAEEFAETRVLSPHDRETGNTMLGIVRYEERALDNPERAGGVLYDGLGVQERLGTRLPDDERGLDHTHTLFSRAVSWAPGATTTAAGTNASPSSDSRHSSPSPDSTRRQPNPKPTTKRNRNTRCSPAVHRRGRSSKNR